MATPDVHPVGGRFVFVAEDMDTDQKQIEAAARAELDVEDYRARVDAAKADIRARHAARRWWHTIIPITIRIERRPRIV
jgi:hypothetical protein